MAIEHVLVPIVMEAEATPFVEHLELEPSTDIFPAQTPFLAFTGSHKDTKITVITMGKDAVYGTGVDNAGTVPASLAVFLAIEKMKGLGTPVDLVLNGGTCGGFARKGGEIGDVYILEGVANHDRRIPIPGFDAYGVGSLTSEIDPSSMAKALGYKTGVCTTGNSLDTNEIDDEKMKSNDASVKDMEAAAIAWVAKMNSIPYLGLKVITDIVDGGVPVHEEFMANLATAAKSLQSALPKVVTYVCENNVGSGTDEL
eukprot:CAMPEP_0197183042 /NCGR_PEP_ID=MMETSP1423-20130617/7325_1 /TAXON_ID=476441 /ORGANISM="Pseudo-nitzschia heimii, Strain UNC1101" /LENGTH=255 /DNA_ID=CAMNT_0042633571 /DNA_START=139 /DNA_END=906 /DNA_ORIENTATION=+